MSRDLQVGFDYGLNAVLQRKYGVEDFDIVQMEWGFIPPYWKNREEVKKYREGFKDNQGKWVQYITLNATAEEMLLPRKMYREAALKRRCLVLSTGFFEWRHVFPPNKRTGLPTKTAVKYPYYISVKGQDYFYMAGIWQEWTDQDTGEIVKTVSVVTTEANELMTEVHNSKKRMPTILNEELAYEWMFGDLSEERITEIGKTKFPAKEMEACSIAKDFREKLEPAEPYTYEDLPAIELSL
ncbi:SOS response-associated peptidase family protein [Pedobacter sp. UBA4863]|uniref:SOS response-associated peptidase n=1 Tax=Pedobacter sp. UBA4863 TaxID=1947060 RepID=UPI0025D43BFF|nr:SOS response-associated peptidase family protein [Pedobacter sp. UBA4863]